MKYLLIVFLLACEPLTTTSPIASGDSTLADVVSQDSTKAPVKPAMALAWGKDHPDWGKALIDAVMNSDLKDVPHPCPKSYSTKECLIQALSIASKYESGFKPETVYEECSNDKTKYTEVVWVESKKKWCRKSSAPEGYAVSRGLLQISISSSNSSSYKCGTKEPKQLHDPIFNLQCGVKIAVFQINKSGKFYSDNKEGLSAYWSVFRGHSDSRPKILTYLKGLK